MTVKSLVKGTSLVMEGGHVTGDGGRLHEHHSHRLLV